MDQRIAYITNLKNHITRHNSIQKISTSTSPEREDPDNTEYQFIRNQVKNS